MRPQGFLLFFFSFFCGRVAEAHRAELRFVYAPGHYAAVATFTLAVDPPVSAASHLKVADLYGPFGL
jgi:hypothetical protein